MALDAQIKQYLDDYNAAGHAPYSSFEPKALRQIFYQNFQNKKKPDPIAVAEVKSVSIDGEASMINLRLYYPAGIEPNGLPALMYFHGGGFVIRDHMDIYDQTCRMICAGVGCVIIAVDYRLAPEHPFPAAPNDCYRATCWVAEHAGELGIDKDRFGVWGESCGGNLAAVVPLMARDRQGPALCCQIIIAGMMEYRFDTPSYIENGSGDYFLSEDSMRWFWNHYLALPEDATNPYCAPLQANDLSNLPPAYVVSLEYDPLRDEGEAYAKQLTAAGVATQYQCYPGLIHGFFDLYTISQAADQACKDIMKNVQHIM